MRKYKDFAESKDSSERKNAVYLFLEQMEKRYNLYDQRREKLEEKEEAELSDKEKWQLEHSEDKKDCLAEMHNAVIEAFENKDMDFGIKKIKKIKQDNPDAFKSFNMFSKSHLQDFYAECKNILKTAKEIFKAAEEQSKQIFLPPLPEKLETSYHLDNDSEFGFSDSEDDNRSSFGM
ncbi:hypothetical protein [Legionella israelensis]|uniref:Uncharacterized protein n=2 Tax=Legionella israelensis TaxID=454 RepID=A0A0W0WQJ4_9GAMM|nr:hypothetical protein [Legionella israelensis]KTD34602.1 hypothetical protein Lisr_0146 [Legionella israelensis]SCY00274.1 hypothetical protein SAMN02746069_00962 [Legionella israelensis DSM 19235]STX60436.1 Uncharacterised protein [Legionella israelensis]